MADVSYGKITQDGLWDNNAGFVQLLGLCPLLAVSGTVVNALGMALATTLVLVLSSTVIAAIRNTVPDEIRIPVFVMVIAAFVTITQLLIQAFAFPLYQTLGLFIALITTNCAIIARAEAFAARNDILRSATDGLMMGLGFALVLLTMGSVREIIGNGSWFADANLLFGEAARDWGVNFSEYYRGLLVAALPPGAFIVLGLLIAVKNVVDGRLKKRADKRSALATAA